MRKVNQVFNGVLTFLLFVQPYWLFSQDSDKQPNYAKDKYISTGFGFEGDSKPNFFGLIEYFFSPGKQKKYFTGIGFYILKNEEKTNTTFNGNVGEMNNNIQIGSLHLTQKYYFHPQRKITPFIGFDAGFRTFNQDVYFKHKTNIIIIIIPATVTTQDSVFETKKLSFTTNLSGGLKFNLNDMASISTTLELRNTKPFESYLDERKSFIVAFSIRLQLGFNRRKS